MGLAANPEFRRHNNRRQPRRPTNTPQPRATYRGVTSLFNAQHELLFAAVRLVSPH